MLKQIRHYSEIEDKIIRAVDTIADPIRQTLSPRGGNVIFETDQGDVTVTNDGVTIAKAIEVADPFEDSIIQVIKQSALKTNSQAGDGTSTTILLSSIFIKEGLKLVREGMNQRDVVGAYRDFGVQLKGKIAKMKQKVESDADLFSVAKISANNDEEIAKDVVKIVRTAGEDGYIFIEPSNTAETEIIEDTGFIIDAGMFTPELANTPNGTAVYNEVPVLITDKRLYYPEEAETILNLCLKNGYKQLVVVAKDFIGEALPFFVANHLNGNTVRVLLVKDPNVEKSNGATLEDLASYLNGEVISDKLGKIVDNLEIDNFCMAHKVYSDGRQTVIMRDPKDETKRLDTRVKNLKAEIKKLGDDDSDNKKALKKRLASLTNGIVTVRIGGSTPIEVKEKRFRYEDAISAGRAAVRDGYLVGGGVSILRAFKQLKYTGELAKVFRKVAEANVRQIAENSGLHGDTVLDTIAEVQAKSDNEFIGYNALTGEYSDLLADGVIDPYKVTEMAIDNSISIAGAIISSRYLIVNARKEEGNSDNSRGKEGA